MRVGVVYKFKKHNKINGSLFYCFEYYQYLKKHIDVKFYVVDISDSDLNLVKCLLEEKYTVPAVITPITVTGIYAEQLDRTVTLDIRTFQDCKEFFSGEVHCFSNEAHDMFRYKNSRQVTYYGSYPYQNYDEFDYLKLNFDIFRTVRNNSGVFVSSRDQEYIKVRHREYEQRFNKPVYLKQTATGVGNMFDLVDHVHYVHLLEDTNNRIIPEAFYHGKTVTRDNLITEVDSVKLRYDDITTNGLVNYTLTDSDRIIQACLR